MKKVFFFLCTFLFIVTQVHGSAVIERRKRMAQQQQAARQAAIQKQTAVEQQMYAQAAAQKQQQMQMQKQAYQQQQMRRGMSQVPSGSKPSINNETLELHEIWTFFEEKSDLWMYMVDVSPKRKTVERFISSYRDKGIYIQKDADFYVSMIDDMLSGNSTLLHSPFADILKFVAIMEYDFDNGQDKDRMARRLLGDKVYQENKMRLGR